MYDGTEEREKKLCMTPRNFMHCRARGLLNALKTREGFPDYRRFVNLRMNKKKNAGTNSRRGLLANMLPSETLQSIVVTSQVVSRRTKIRTLLRRENHDGFPIVQSDPPQVLRTALTST